MKRLLMVSLALLTLTAALAQEDHGDELKVYGVISYLAEDQSSLYLGDLFVSIKGAEVEGTLGVGALVEVEGDWHGATFQAHEIEVERGASPQTVIYKGQVREGKLLGLVFPDLPEGAQLAVIAEIEREGELQVLVVRNLDEAVSGVEGSVTALSEDGFVVADVRVISAQNVEVGERIRIEGEWDGLSLRAEP